MPACETEPRIHSASGLHQVVSDWCVMLYLRGGCTRSKMFIASFWKCAYNLASGQFDAQKRHQHSKWKERTCKREAGHEDVNTATHCMLKWVIRDWEGTVCVVVKTMLKTRVYQDWDKRKRWGVKTGPRTYKPLKTTLRIQLKMNLFCCHLCWYV